LIFVVQAPLIRERRALGGDLMNAGKLREHDNGTEEFSFHEGSGLWLVTSTIFFSCKLVFTPHPKEIQQENDFRGQKISNHNWVYGCLKSIQTLTKKVSPNSSPDEQWKGGNWAMSGR
jgi:hypothetical protein